MKREIFFFVLFGLTFSLYFTSCRKETIQSQRPVAAAGRDITVQLPHEKIVLDADSSYDPDGGNIKYLWSKISGPDFITITDPTSPHATLRYLTEGVYQIELMVTDKSGASAYDTVTITILKYPSGFEIKFELYPFYFNRQQNELFTMTNSRPDVFFNYAAPMTTYLHAEVRIKLYSDTSWILVRPKEELDPALGEQYLYRTYRDIMYVFRYPADPRFDEKQALVKLKFF